MIPLSTICSRRHAAGAYAVSRHAVERLRGLSHRSRQAADRRAVRILRPLTGAIEAAEPCAVADQLDLCREAFVRHGDNSGYSFRCPAAEPRGLPPVRVMVSYPP